MTEHELKIWPDQFEATVQGDKRAEFRRADRAYTEGDVLHLMEWLPSEGRYTGRALDAAVTHVERDERFGIPPGYAVLSIEMVASEPYCTKCGCTESAACPGGCSWSTLDIVSGEGLCTRCA